MNGEGTDDVKAGAGAKNIGIAVSHYSYLYITADSIRNIIPDIRLVGRDGSGNINIIIKRAGIFGIIKFYVRDLGRTVQAPGNSVVVGAHHKIRILRRLGHGNHRPHGKWVCGDTVNTCRMPRIRYPHQTVLGVLIRHGDGLGVRTGGVTSFTGYDIGPTGTTID